MNTILIILIALFAIYQYKKYEGKPFRYFLGSIAILLGVIFIEPSPDPISFGAYALSHGLSTSVLNASNFSNYIWAYEIWSVPIGIGLVLIGMWLLKWSWKRVWDKISPGKYSLALLIAFVAVMFVALLDILSANSGIFGSLIQYTQGDFGADWWPLFFKFVLVIFAIPAICYYALVSKDKSEAIGIFGFSLILYFGGVADLFYFMFQKLPLPSELPWLAGNPVISFISNNLGYSTVTNISLLFSVFISIIVAWLFAKVLKEKF